MRVVTYNMVNPNRGQEGENDFIKISKEDRDSYMRGDQGAQDLKSKYVDKITAANAGQDGSALRAYRCSARTGHFF